MEDPAYKEMNEKYERKESLYKFIGTDLIFSSNVLVLSDGNVIESVTFNEFATPSINKNISFTSNFFDSAKKQIKIIEQYKKLDSNLSAKFITKGLKI